MFHSSRCEGVTLARQVPVLRPRTRRHHNRQQHSPKHVAMNQGPLSSSRLRTSRPSCETTKARLRAHRSQEGRRSDHHCHSQGSTHLNPPSRGERPSWLMLRTVSTPGQYSASHRQTSPESAAALSPPPPAILRRENISLVLRRRG